MHSKYYQRHVWQNKPISCFVPYAYLPHLSGFFLHLERLSVQRRRDGTVPKPSMFERYLHRPLDNLFDDLDIVTYQSQFNQAKLPPAYANNEQWDEHGWDVESHHNKVFRRRPTPKV